MLCGGVVDVLLSVPDGICGSGVFSADVVDVSELCVVDVLLSVLFSVSTDASELRVVDVLFSVLLSDPVPD